MLTLVFAGSFGATVFGIDWPDSPRARAAPGIAGSAEGVADHTPVMHLAASSGPQAARERR